MFSENRDEIQAAAEDLGDGDETPNSYVPIGRDFTSSAVCTPRCSLVCCASTLAITASIPRKRIPRRALLELLPARDTPYHIAS